MSFTKTDKADAPMRKKADCAEEKKFVYSVVKTT